jgi:hypothetical protein
VPTSRRQKASATGLPPVSSTRPVHPSVAHPLNPPNMPQVNVKTGKFPTLKASVGPKPKGR